MVDTKDQLDTNDVADGPYSVQKLATVIRDSVQRVIVGKSETIDIAVLSLLCRGHLLLEDVPGTGKTTLAKALAASLDCDFGRIQFTPDLVPADVLGVNFFNTAEAKFEFRAGPVFSQIILADEINRATPRTQSALLEAMQERQVSIDGITSTLPEPFVVMATLNPVEMEGTFPLPEAQLDRFLFKLKIDYPSAAEEVDIVKSTTGDKPEIVKPVVNQAQMVEFQDLIRKIPVADNVIEYAVNFVRKTRPNEGIIPESIQKLLDWGAGPRASAGLILAAKANAVLTNRTTPDIADVQLMIKPVLRHRIIPNFNAESEGVTSDDILDLILQDK